MINVSQEVRSEYLKDSVNKTLKVKTKNPLLNEINFYTANITSRNVTLLKTSSDGELFGQGIYASTFEGTPFESWSFFESAKYQYAQGRNYVAVSLLYNLVIVTSYTGDPTGYWQINYRDANGFGRFYNVNQSSLSAYWNKTDRLVLVFPIPYGIMTIDTIYFFTDEDIPYTLFQVKQGSMQVNFIDDPDNIPDYLTPPDFSTFDPTKDIGWEIANDELLYEDFTLTESLCSQNNLKFGLCEAAHIEFGMVSDVYAGVGTVIKPTISTRDEARDITDADIFAINWVRTTLESSTYTVYDEDFTESASIIFEQANNNADWTDYITPLELIDKYIHIGLDIKLVFNNLTGTKPTYFKAFYTYVTNNGNTLVESGYYNVSDYEDTYNSIFTNSPLHISIPGILERVMTKIQSISLAFYDANKASYTEGMAECDAVYYWKDIQYRIGASADVMPGWSADDLYVANGTIDEYVSELLGGYTIPLGVYTITDISRNYHYNYVERKVTAYDNLLLLEQNAADWYTQYMYGVDFDSEPSHRGFTFARQIFSTYWSYIESIGLDSVDNYDLTTVKTLTTSNFICYASSCYGYVMWSNSGNDSYRCYAAETCEITDNTLLYRVIYDNVLDLSDAEIMSLYNPNYVPNADTIWRGFGDNGGVCIEEYRSGANEPYNRFCVNRGAFFMLSPETAFIKVVLPSGYKTNSGYSLCQNIKLQAATPRQTLVNGYLRLLYYNYVTKDIFACDSSITGRDVVRSLLEVCGCFFRLDRFNGLPEFVYPQKGGLYPSNTLYPADDLYPRGADTEVVPMGKYISLRAADYKVKNFGRIQILKDAKSSDTKSVVEWQYEGDANAENTYIIDDNIFYCADGMMYDYDNMPEVSTMLENMWTQISNMGYVPNDTNALGAPWIECGDRVGLLTFDGGFETFVFRRTLKGIQNLRDAYEADGDECNETIDDYGYSIYSV